MSNGAKIALVVTGLLAVGGAAFYFINKSQKRKKTVQIQVTPELAIQVKNMVG